MLHLGSAEKAGKATGPGMTGRGLVTRMRPPYPTTTAPASVPTWHHQQRAAVASSAQRHAPHPHHTRHRCNLQQSIVDPPLSCHARHHCVLLLPAYDRASRHAPHQRILRSRAITAARPTARLAPTHRPGRHRPCPASRHTLRQWVVGVTHVWPMAPGGNLPGGVKKGRQGCRHSRQEGAGKDVGVGRVGCAARRIAAAMTTFCKIDGHNPSRAQSRGGTDGTSGETGDRNALIDRACSLEPNRRTRRKQSEEPR